MNLFNFFKMAVVLIFCFCKKIFFVVVQSCLLLNRGLLELKFWIEEGADREYSVV